MACCHTVLFVSRRVPLPRQHGHDEVFRWLFENRPERCPANKNIFDWVAQNGHLSVIKVLHELGVEGCTQRAMNWAATGGHMETVQWLHENRTEVKVWVRS